MQTVAALTILRDGDTFSLQAWLRHYGGQIGRENCTIVSAGSKPELPDMAQGCNLVRLPEDAADSVKHRQGRIVNNFVAALRCYYTHVIISEPDEMVVVDPDAGGNLVSFLETQPGGRVLTPLGLELIHRVDCETTPIANSILGPRRHVRPSTKFSKPCIISRATSLSRNRRFSRYQKLVTPNSLYLIQMKNCTKSDGSGAEPFNEFAKMDMQDGFRLEGVRQQMHDSWEKRGDTGYWHFTCPDFSTQYLLPERFEGLF